MPDGWSGLVHPGRFVGGEMAGIPGRDDKTWCVCLMGGNLITNNLNPTAFPKELLLKVMLIPPNKHNMIHIPNFNSCTCT